MEESADALRVRGRSAPVPQAALVAIARRFCSESPDEPLMAWHVEPIVRLGRRRYQAWRFLSRWLSDARAPNLLLLGGHGAGKTQFCQVAVHRLLMRWREDRSNVFPIFCPLAEASGYKSIGEFLRHYLHAMGLEAGGRDESAILSGGRWLVVLDGLDEVQSQTDTNVRRLFEQLQELPVDRCRLLVSARTHLFLRTDQVAGVAGFGDWYQAARRLGVRDFFLVAELAPFNGRQQRAYLRRRVRATMKEIERAISETYGLSELASRPLFLRMFVDTFAELRRGRTGALKSWDVLNAYVEMALKERETRTGIKATTVRRVSQEVAVRLYRDLRTSVDSSELPSASVRDSMGTVDPWQPGDLMLSRHGDRLSFAHHTLFEFFLADALASDLSRRRPSLLSRSTFSRETLILVVDALRPMPGTFSWKWLVDVVAERPGKMRWLWVNSLALLSIANVSELASILPGALDHVEDHVVGAALKLVGYYRIASAKPRIRRLLQSRSAGIRRLAVEAAGLHRLSAASSAVREGLASSDPAMRSICLWAARKIRSAELVEPALTMVERGGEQEVRAGSEVLGMRQEPASLGALLRASMRKDVSPWTQYYVDEAIRAVRAKPIQNWNDILSVSSDCERFLSLRAPEWKMRYVIERIGERRLQEFSGVLMALFPHAPPQVRHSIVDALGEMRTVDSTSFLRGQYSTEGSPEVRADIVWALGNSGDIASLGVIIDSLSDPAEVVRRWGRWARAQFGAAESLVWQDLFCYPSCDSEQRGVADSVQG